MNRFYQITYKVNNLDRSMTITASSFKDASNKLQELVPGATIQTITSIPQSTEDND